MSTSVTASIEELDLVVYGQVQYNYALTEDGVTRGGLLLDEMLTACTNARALAVDHEVQMVSEIVRKRTQKVEDLGNAMAAIQYITSCFDSEAGQNETYPDSDHMIRDDIDKTMITSLRNYTHAYDLTCKTYDDATKTTTTYKINDLLDASAREVNGSTVGSDRISLYWIQTIQSAVQLELDQENNELKQSSNTLQNFVDKRDDAYSLVGKVSDIINGTVGTVVRAMGQ